MRSPQQAETLENLYRPPRCNGFRPTSWCWKVCSSSGTVDAIPQFVRLCAVCALIRAGFRERRRQYGGTPSARCAGGTIRAVDLIAGPAGEVCPQDCGGRNVERQPVDFLERLMGTLCRL